MNMKEENSKKPNEISEEKFHFSLFSDYTIFQQIKAFILSKYHKTKSYQAKLKKKEEEKAKVERIDSQIETGLSSQDVERRIKEGLVNKTPNKYTKSVFSIIVSNVFTYFNILLFIIATILLSFGRIMDCLFLGIAIVNTAMGVIQELRTKTIIDKLKLITTPSNVVIRDSLEKEVKEDELVLDDIVYFKSGDQVSVDCLLLKGEVEVNESALTGESLPVKKSKGDVLLSGSFIVTGTCHARVDKVGEDTFSSKLQLSAKSYIKNSSKLRKSINGFIGIITILLIPFIIGCVYLNSQAGLESEEMITRTAAQAIGIIPSGLILLVSAALCVGVIYLYQSKTLVQDLFSIERLARVDALCLDKTGTLTDGSMSVVEEKLIGIDEEEFKKVISSYMGAFENTNPTSEAIIEKYGKELSYKVSKTMEFSSSRKFSAVEFESSKAYALGAIEYLPCKLDDQTKEYIESQAKKGNRVLGVVRYKDIFKDDKPQGEALLISILVLEDKVRKEAYDTIKWFNENGVDVKIISGDNPLTVSEIARKCGVKGYENYVSLEGKTNEEIDELVDKYSIFGRVTPDQKDTLVKALKKRGKTVAMTGDGINDILAMKRADCSVAMNNATDATKAVAHLILLDSNFASMPKVVEEGRRVVNNVQMSASLFIMKTLFTIFFTLSLVFLNLGGVKYAYPFTPRMMLILEVCIIGMPSFFLALQPNNKLIKGDFIVNVLKSSLPTALGMFMGVFSFILFKLNIPELQSNLLDSSTEIIILLVIGFTNLVFICLPFNKYRTIVVSSFLAIILLVVFFIPPSLIGCDVYSIPSIAWIYFAYSVLIGLATVFVAYSIRYLIRKVCSKKQTESK